MNKVCNILLVLIIGLAAAIAVTAFTNPPGNPPTGGGALGVGSNAPASSLYIASSTGNVGIGTTNLTAGTKLDIDGGNLDLSGNNITGVNKITVNTIDPVFKINGKNYATYVPDVAGGVSVHTFGKATLKAADSQYGYIVDFGKLEEGSDLWLFAKTADFGSKMEKLVVILAPEGEKADLYYQLDASENQLIIYGDKPVTFSYSLSAPRIDHKDWDNLAEDQLYEGIDVSEYQNR